MAEIPILHAGAADRYLSVMPSPIGPLWLYSDGQSLTGLYIEAEEGTVPQGASLERADAPFRAVRAELAAYLAGELQAFSVPLAPRGTAFQRTVWQELLRIPCGESRSYGQVAAAIGRPAASRAVGLANGKNPISLIIPCHRVIGQDGSLTGYAWGLQRKRWLLAHEAEMCRVG